MDPNYIMDISQPSNLEMVFMNQAEEAASNGAGTNTGVQSHAKDIQHFQVTNQPHQSNFLYTQLNQASQSQADTLPSANTGLMHRVLNNWMSSSQPYMSQLDGYHVSFSQPLVNETCPIESQIVQSLLSQQNQIDGLMPYQSNQIQPSHDSGQTPGNKRTRDVIRSKLNRDKRKEMMETLKNENKKATENERGFTEKIEKLTAEKTTLTNENKRLKTEKTTLINDIGKLNAEKIEWKKEREQLTANVAANTESIRKLTSQYEGLSQRISCPQPDEQTTTQYRQSEFEKIHQQDLNSVRGRVFGRIAFIAFAVITDAIAVIADVAVVNFS